MTRLRALSVVLAMAWLVVLGACGGDDVSGVAASTDSADSADNAPFEVSGEPVATALVDLPKSYKFEPAVITVAPGTEVTWTNNDNFPHNVHVFGDNEQTKDLGVGEETSIEFAEAGTYYYECTLHPTQMKGKILVEEA